MWLGTAPASLLLFQVEDTGHSLAELTWPDAHHPHVSHTACLANRVILHTPVSHSIVHVHTGITNLFWTFLDSQAFTKIQSLKLQSTATRFGSNGFKVNYFCSPTFLAQSQFADQMAITTDMEWVVEIGSIFKENPTPTSTWLSSLVSILRWFSRTSTMRLWTWSIECSCSSSKVFNLITSRYAISINLMRWCTFTDLDLF